MEKCIHFNATAYKHRARWVHQQFNTGGERERERGKKLQNIFASTTKGIFTP